MEKQVSKSPARGSTGRESPWCRVKGGIRPLSGFNGEYVDQGGVLGRGLEALP